MDPPFLDLPHRRSRLQFTRLRNGFGKSVTRPAPWQPDRRARPDVRKRSAKRRRALAVPLIWPMPAPFGYRPYLTTVSVDSGVPRIGKWGAAGCQPRAFGARSVGHDCARGHLPPHTSPDQRLGAGSDCIWSNLHPIFFGCGGRDVIALLGGVRFAGGWKVALPPAGHRRDAAGMPPGRAGASQPASSGSGPGGA